MASSQTDDMQWAPSPVHHFDRLPSMDVDYGTHRNSHMQGDSNFASTGLQHPPISTNSSGSGGGGCPYAQNSLRFTRSQAPPLISSSSNSNSNSSGSGSSSSSSSTTAATAAATTNTTQTQQQSSNLDFLCRPSSLFGGSNVRNSPLPDPLGLSYRVHVPSNLGNSSANSSASNNSNSNNSSNTPYDPVHHSLSSPSRLTQQQQQQQQQQPPPPPTQQQPQQQPNNPHTHNHHPHYDRHQVVLPNHPSTFSWGARSSLPPHPRSGSMPGVFCPPQLPPPPPPLTSDPWTSGSIGRGNSLGHPYQHMLPQASHYMSTPNQAHFWHQQGPQSQRAVHFSPPSNSSRAPLTLASLPPLAPRNMASNSAGSSSTAGDATSTAPHMYASPVSSPSSSISSIATSPQSRDLRDLRQAPRDQTPDVQGMAQQSQSADRESTANGTDAPVTAGSPQRRARPESGVSNSSPVLGPPQGALAEEEEHLDMLMSDEDHDYSDGDSNDSHLQDMYVQQLGATAAMAQANREAGRREELEARREERIRQQQLFRGAMTNKRIASRSAISSMESVDIASLPELERTCVICYNDFGVPSPEGISEAPLRLPKCKHVFGDHCIKKWLQDSDTCPYCRDKLPSESVVSVNNRSLNAYLGMNGGSPDPSWFQSDHEAVNLTHDAFVRLYGRQIVSNNSPAASRPAVISNRRPPPPEEQAELRHRRRSRYAAPVNNRRGQAILSGHIGEPNASGTRNEIPRSNSLSGASDPSASQRPMSALHSMNHIPQEWQRLHYSPARSSSSNTATGGQMSTSQSTEAGAISSDGNPSGSASGLGAPEPTSDEAYFGSGGPFSQQLPQLPRLDIRGLVGSSSVSPAYQFWDVNGTR
ncbi:hypothetical protein PpBr36_00361 [Pyricularia pennisetigena]|uniref:hypothetical protein n=1 Tax=Pyricularia pennisetigena TaxID=1578925 RepID=UPI00114F37B0|nr:hypothetical protein PpBr36_00361 [Pyricularia pennisetigena]TLS28900.1 hypothetical protein PpBr36_00361 [Pyricularia pennisetigena]